jgi:predicted DCC family thiol-disulfide oxidoreductase YuxK
MASALDRGHQRTALGLTVLYDERCPLCRRLKGWLAMQPTLTQIELVPADSPVSHARFPDLDHGRSIQVLTVVTSDGLVYEGERAWLLCGWALPRWRQTAEHLATPGRLRLVRIAARVVDGYRHRGMRHDDTACCTVAAPRERTDR